MKRRLFPLVPVCIALVWVMASCTKTMLETAKQPGYFQDTREVRQQSPEERQKLSFLKDLPAGEELSFNLPEYIIDDFEHGLKKWKILSTSAVKSDIDEMVSIQTNNTVVRISYTMPQKQIRLNPDFILVKVRKDARFENYKGVRFLARAVPPVRMSVLLIETNQIRKDLVGTEIWGQSVNLTSLWQQFRVDFKKLKHEEYYEQNYIGDDIQDLKSIRQVGFRVDNSVPLGSKSGNFFLDDVTIY